MVPQIEVSGIFRGCALGILAVFALGCFPADPRTPEGALDMASRALERGDGKMLFRVLDQRTRHAMDSIVKSRREAASLIKRSYPETEQRAALIALGDAAHVREAAGLFDRRCDIRCRVALHETVGAPKTITQDGDEILVHTTRGTQLRMFLGTDTWYGIVWKTEELSAELAAQRILVKLESMGFIR